jgi:hypothetical protein
MVKSHRAEDANYTTSATGKKSSAKGVKPEMLGRDAFPLGPGGVKPTGETISFADFLGYKPEGGKPKAEPKVQTLPDKGPIPAEKPQVLPTEAAPVPTPRPPNPDPNAPFHHGGAGSGPANFNLGSMQLPDLNNPALQGVPPELQLPPNPFNADTAGIDPRVLLAMLATGAGPQDPTMGPGKTGRLPPTMPSQERFGYPPEPSAERFGYPSPARFGR